MKVKKTDKESVEWLNNLVERVFPQIVEFTENITKEKIKEAMAKLLKEKPPPAVSKIAVPKLSFGTMTPKLSDLSSIRRAAPELYILDFSMEFFSDATVDVAATVTPGIPVTIRVDGIKLKGRMRVEVTFKKELPFLKKIAFAFKKLPEFDIAIRIAKGMDVNSIPGVESWLKSTVFGVLKGMMVLPNIFTVELETNEDGKIKVAHEVKQKGAATAAIAGIGNAGKAIGQGVGAIGQGIGQGVGAVGKGVMGVGKGGAKVFGAMGGAIGLKKSSKGSKSSTNGKTKSGEEKKSNSDEDGEKTSEKHADAAHDNKRKSGAFMGGMFSKKKKHKPTSPPTSPRATDEPVDPEEESTSKKKKGKH
eukprot:CAMPEP_0168522496 /NCGR_PEP_ID=MMETSP0405-20121227/9381_1 /TAXON_ID=498012 /ORGANISM="Trichosphaerium sp, Strain Am-I-7 wt" /LENGTH=361 /DNA_ID=CAMNT_0008544107 /DNA_START=242 /DNA_END=1327 /DNA_ORIENTATION=-